jgi:hypothetical protein
LKSGANTLVYPRLCPRLPSTPRRWQTDGRQTADRRMTHPCSARPMMHESAADASQDAQGRVQQRLQRRITLFMGQTRSRKRVGALMQLCVRRHAPPPVTGASPRGAERERVCSESLELRSEGFLRRQCAAAALDGGRMAGRGGCGGGETHTRPASCTACDMVAFLRSKLRTRSQFVRSRWNCVPRFA